MRTNRNRIAGVALGAWSVFPIAGALALAANFGYWWSEATEPCDTARGMCNEGPMYGLLVAGFGLLGIPLLLAGAVVAVLLGVRLARSRLVHAWPVVALVMMLITGLIASAAVLFRAEGVSPLLGWTLVAMAMAASPVLLARSSRHRPSAPRFASAGLDGSSHPDRPPLR